MPVSATPSQPVLAIRPPRPRVVHLTPRNFPPIAVLTLFRRTSTAVIQDETQKLSVEFQNGVFSREFRENSSVMFPAGRNFRERETQNMARITTVLFALAALATVAIAGAAPFQTW